MEKIKWAKSKFRFGPNPKSSLFLFHTNIVMTSQRTDLSALLLLTNQVLVNPVNVADLWFVLRNELAGARTHRDVAKLVFACTQTAYLRCVEKEVVRTPQRVAVLESALSSLTHVCLSQACVASIVSCSSLLAALVNQVIVNGPPDSSADRALTCLTSLALFPASREALRGCGVVPLCSAFLRFLDSANEVELDFGLTAASMLVRLGEMEPVLNARQTQLVVDKTTKLLSLVLDAGEHGVVLGYNRDPANIVFDLSLLAKEGCGGEIELIRKAVEVRGKHNVRLTGFACHAVLALKGDHPLALRTWWMACEVFEHVLKDENKLDVSTFQTMAGLVNELRAQPAPSFFLRWWTRLRRLILSVVVL